MDRLGYVPLDDGDSGAAGRPPGLDDGAEQPLLEAMQAETLASEDDSAPPIIGLVPDSAGPSLITFTNGFL